MLRRHSAAAGLAAFLIVLMTSAQAGAAPEPSKDSPKGVARPSAAAATVTLRVGKHPRFVRIVLEATEEHVEKASVMLSGESAIKVAFRSPIYLMVAQKTVPQRVVPLEGLIKGKQPYEMEKGITVTAGGAYCVVTVAGLDDINVSKLSGPSRLVIDAYIGSAAPGQPAERSSAESSAEAAAAPLLEELEVPFAAFVLDAGHGGVDSGIQFGKVAEKDIALSFARDVAALLTKKAKKVTQTRKGDHVLTLRERIKTAQQKAPDLLLSFHVASGNELVVYTAPRQGAAASPEKDPAAVLAQSLVLRARSVAKVEARHERLPLPLLTNAGTTALLIELPSPEKFSYDGKNKARLIRAILQGLTPPAPVQAQGTGQRQS